MSSRASLRPWPRCRTTAHSARRWPGRGGGGGENEVKYTAAFGAGAEYYSLDAEDAPAAGRPTPLAEVRPQSGVARHGGIGYELVLATALPKIGVEEDMRGAVGAGLIRAIRNLQAEQEEIARARESESSSKRNKIRRKKRKRRKKKLPKTHSSSSLLRQSNSQGGAGDEGQMHDEFEDVGKTEYVQRADVPREIHTVHAEPLNSVHCKEVTG